MYSNIRCGTKVFFTIKQVKSNQPIVSPANFEIRKVRTTREMARILQIITNNIQCN